MAEAVKTSVGNTKSASKVAPEWEVAVEPHAGREQWATKAWSEVNEYDARAVTSSTALDFAGRKVFQPLLGFIESFELAGGELDADGLDEWLTRHGAAPHGKTSNIFQRCAKAFATPATSRALQSKRGSVLWALRHRRIRAEDVLDEFERSERVGKNGAIRSGLARFEAIHKGAHDSRRPPAEGEQSEVSETEETAAARSEIVASEALAIIRALIEQKRIKLEIGEISALATRAADTEGTLVITGTR